MAYSSSGVNFQAKAHEININAYSYWIILAIWLFSLFWNINKAYHIDDTAHLEIAQWIASNPLHPMSGLLSWERDIEPIYQTNQPHLYFYLMAFWAKLFGWHEVSMHALMSLFVLWAIVEFYKLAKIVTPNSALLSTSLLGLSPGFVVGQNSMVDIPLLAIWMCFFRILIEPEINDFRRYALSALLCSVAVLIKYTSLVLIPGLFFHLILYKRYNYLFFVLVPLMTLLAWSLFNIYDYGGIHLLGRKTGSVYWRKYVYRSFEWIVALGTISPFALFFFFARYKEAPALFVRYIWMLALLICCASPVLMCLSLFVTLPEDVINRVFICSFFITGIGLLSMITVDIVNQVITWKLSYQKLLLLYWLSSGFIFIILLAPFMATRHVLLVIPPVLLLLFSWGDNLKFPRTALAVIFTSIFVTSLVAAADSWYADIYRKYATLIRDNLPGQAGIWYTGHWGWQWYAAQAGMMQLSATRDHPAVGDFIVTPDNVSSSKFPKNLELTLEKTINIQRNHRYQNFASIDFYSSHGLTPSLSYSIHDMETFSIWKVVRN